MEITVSHETGAVPITVFRLEGDWLHEEPVLSRAREAIGAGTRNLLLDLAAVPFISSAGLRALHEMYTLLQGPIAEDDERAVRRQIATGTYKSPHLKLLNPSRNALRALSVAGYDMFLAIFERRAEALASYAG